MSTDLKSSPQARGCFSLFFPAFSLVASLPRRRGGVSLDYQLKLTPYQSSPQARGCFYPYSSYCKNSRSLPRRRGGVSYE